MADLFLYRNIRKKAHINLTPLIDCMFMLILFFIVTTTFNKSPGIEIALPKITKGVSFEAKENLEISVTKDKKVYLNKAEVEVEKLGGSVKAAMEKNQAEQLFMKADTDVPYGFIVKVMNELRLAGVKNVAAVTEENEEKKEP